MADDEPIDDEEFDAEGLEDEELAEDLDDEELAEDPLVVADDDEGVVVDEAADDDEEEAAPARPKADEEDDDDEVDPDDVEADLDAILKDRIAAADDDDDEDEEVAPEPKSAAEVAEGVTPKKANEFMCTGCFLLVNAGQFGPPGQRTCPVGEAVCPAIEQLEKGK
jgi:hypothetical protein